VVLILGLAKVMNSSLSIGTDVLNYSRWYRWSLPLIGLLTLSAILLNTVLIGLWDINGAAAATLLSYALYFVLLLSMLWWRLRVSLFSLAQLKVVAVVLAGFGLNWLWTAWVAPMVTGLWPGLGGLIVDAALKTLLLGGVVAAVVLAWRVSPTVNGMLLGRFKGLKR
jgi:O-antigen/teichoic acid export membrane protein